MDYKFAVIVFCAVFTIGYFVLSYGHHVARKTGYTWTPAQVIGYTIAMPFVYALFVLLAPITAILFCVHVVESKNT